MIWTIARRELVTRARSKGFLIITAVMFTGILAGSVVVTLFEGESSARTVTIGIEATAAGYVDALSVGNDDLDPTVITVNDGQGRLRADEIDVLFDGTTLTWKGSPDNTLDTYIRSVVQEVTFGRRADELGLGPADIGRLFEQVEVTEVRLDGGDDEFGVRFAAATVAGFASFMLIQIWGAFLMVGVTEEKSSKVIEVLLSHVRPATLLTGKVLGLGILALGQMLIVVSGMALGLVLVRDIAIPPGVWGTVPLLVVTFLLGFGFYATAFAAVGSMVSRQEDVQTAQLPVVAPLLIGYFIAASSFSAPENLAVTIGSFVPFTAPVLLPFRTAMVDVPLWQVLLALVAQAAGIVVMLQLAGRIYRYSLLRTGTRVTWTDAWRHRHQEGF